MGEMTEMMTIAEMRQRLRDADHETLVDNYIALNIAIGMCATQLVMARLGDEADSVPRETIATMANDAVEMLFNEGGIILASTDRAEVLAEAETPCTDGE